MQGYRYGGLVSKGGASMVAWMKANHKENPLYARFDRVVAILKNTMWYCPWAMGCEPALSVTLLTGP
jgi:thiamine biosynthesis protein ThiC